MKQIGQNYRTGGIHLEDANAPVLQRGGVLVQSRYSGIFAWTEGKISCLNKARPRHDKLRKTLDIFRQQGSLATYRKVMKRLETITPYWAD